MFGLCKRLDEIDSDHDWREPNDLIKLNYIQEPLLSFHISHTGAIQQKLFIVLHFICISI